MHANRKQLLDRRALRNRKAFSVSPQIFLVVIVGSIGIVWVVALALLSFLDRGNAPNQAMVHGFVDSSVDLWPNDRQSGELLNILVSCIPEEKNDETCRERRKEESATQQIALARPPGLLGKIMQNFVEKLVESHPIEHDAAELIPTTHVPLDHSFTKIIRFAVLPILLEAADLALSTTDPSFTKQQITVSDIEEIVRLLIHWHCRLMDIANDTAFLTLSAKRALSRPQEAAKEIGSFIGFDIDKGEDWMSGKSVDRRASLAMERIDECSNFISELQAMTPRRNLQELANTIVHNEIASGKCGDAGSDERFQSTRVTQIVRKILGPDHDAICKEFPAISLCASSI